MTGWQPLVDETTDDARSTTTTAPDAEDRGPEAGDANLDGQVDMSDLTMVS